jgi:CII-binding regulator of phage lambda lysogenization HflD
MHVTEIVKQTRTTDETVEVTIRCCSNPKTDSTITVYGLNEEKLLADIEKHHDRVAAKCAQMAASQKMLMVPVKKTKTHGA